MIVDSSPITFWFCVRFITGLHSTLPCVPPTLMANLSLGLRMPPHWLLRWPMRCASPAQCSWTRPMFSHSPCVLDLCKQPPCFQVLYKYVQKYMHTNTLLLILYFAASLCADFLAFLHILLFYSSTWGSCICAPCTSAHIPSHTHSHAHTHTHTHTNTHTHTLTFRVPCSPRKSTAAHRHRAAAPSTRTQASRFRSCELPVRKSQKWVWGTNNDKMILKLVRTITVACQSAKSKPGPSMFTCPINEITMTNKSI